MLHPKIVNVDVGEGSAGEEAIGILTTFMKAKLKIVPLFFFLLAVMGALIVLAGFFGDRMAASFAQYVPIPMGGLPFGFVGAALIVAACLVPILVYFIFLIQYLILDVIRAILAVPGKLDALRR
jgi:TRAP-type C4-dicarboxylate transport system permease small subunit